VSRQVRAATGVAAAGRRAAKAAAVALAVAGLLGGCASVGRAAGASPNPRDPWEAMNRRVFVFNDTLDAYVLRPVATAYRDWVPSFARTGVSNVFNNVGDLWGGVNALLQGKGEAGLTDLMRFSLNTVFGLGGLLDIATEAGMERSGEDFGQTLGRWGLAAGPYLVLPLLGPSSLRDAAALPLDLSATPASAIDKESSKYLLNTLGTVQTRAKLLGASQVLEGIALDKYSFLRDAYLARRRSLVHDGDPPEEPAEEPAGR
jgi:phospholipid-binding lipoprotein MlaA